MARHLHHDRQADRRPRTGTQAPRDRVYRLLPGLLDASTGTDADGPAGDDRQRRRSYHRGLPHPHRRNPAAFPRSTPRRDRGLE